MCPTCGAVATEIKTQAPVLFPRSRHTCARRARWATPLEKEVWAGSRLHREPNPHLLRPLLAEVHVRLARVLRGLCYCRAHTSVHTHTSTATSWSADRACHPRPREYNRIISRRESGLPRPQSDSKNKHLSDKYIETPHPKECTRSSISIRSIYVCTHRPTRPLIRLFKHSLVHPFIRSLIHVSQVTYDVCTHVRTHTSMHVCTQAFM